MPYRKNDFNAIHYIGELSCCYICGYNNAESLTSGDICPCCFTEWGFDEHNTGINNSISNMDSFIKAIILVRKNWLENGAKFDDKDLIPEGWNMQMALKQIEDNVPEEFK